MPLATITRLEPFNINNSATFSFASTSVTANVSAGNVLTDNLLYANGVAWTFSNYSNTNVAAYLPTYSGNVSAAYFIGNGSTLTSITGGNVTGQVANALVSGTVYSNAQPNITSVGTLSSLNVTANASAGNILTDNLLYANGVAWSLGGTYSNTNVAAYLPTYTGNYAGNNVTLTGNISTGTGTGNISGANYVIANYFTGTLTTAAQPNITSVGTLSSLNVTGNISSSGNILVTANISSGNANLGNAVTANYFIGNGSQLTGLPAGYSNTNVAAYLPTYTGNFTAGNISTTGNITAAYFIGDGSQLTGLPASYSNTNVAAYLPTYTGNLSANVITANNATINGSITTGSGTGNISGANFVNANYFTGNGSLLSSITGANVNGAVSYATTANSVAGGNVSGQVSNALIAGTVYTNAQPNITSVGTLNGLSVTGNVNVTGNINVTGNLNYSNVTDLVVGDPLIYLGANNTGNLVDLGIVASYNDGSYYHTGFARDHTDGTWKLFTGVSQEPTTVIDWANATYAGFKAGNIITSNANLGNLATANYFSGNGSLLTSITGANVTGQVGNALVAGTVYTGEQPNITSVGTLVSVSVTGNVSSGGNIIGNGQYLTSLTGANVTGTVANANYATYSGTAYSVSGSNVSGDVSGANHANIADVANSVAGGNVTGQVGNALVAGTVYIGAQPNITSVGSLIGLTVSNATGVVNFDTTANVTLGAVGNLHISGGSANYYLKTDGSGNLSWAAVSAGGGGTYTAAATPPASGNVVGDQWFNTTANILYEYLNDGTSNYWVDTTSSSITSNPGSSGTVDTINPLLLMGA